MIQVPAYPLSSTNKHPWTCSVGGGKKESLMGPWLLLAKYGCPLAAPPPTNLPGVVAGTQMSHGGRGTLAAMYPKTHALIVLGTALAPRRLAVPTLRAAKSAIQWAEGQSRCMVHPCRPRGRRENQATFSRAFPGSVRVPRHQDVKVNLVQRQNLLAMRARDLSAMGLRRRPGIQPGTCTNYSYTRCQRPPTGTMYLVPMHVPTGQPIPVACPVSQCPGSQSHGSVARCPRL